AGQPDTKCSKQHFWREFHERSPLLKNSKGQTVTKYYERESARATFEASEDVIYPIDHDSKTKNDSFVTFCLLPHHR
ncbi:hypothetical protein, partial [Pseudomonas viridiflava]